MRLPTQNLLAWEISVTLFHLLAVGATLLRLVHRWRTKRMWWDDYSAFVVLVVDVLSIILLWLRFRYGVAGLTGQKGDSFFYSFWLSAAVGWAVIWGSRVSLSLSIARIFPEHHASRRFSFGMSITFSLSYAALLLVLAFICKPNLEGGWYHLNFNHTCFKARSTQLLASFLGMDLTAETLLIVTPLVMLWKIKLPTKERRLILALFSSSIVSLISSVMFAIIWFFAFNSGADSRVLSYMFMMLQTAISLLICNLLVITMLIYRILQREVENDDRATGPSPSPVNGQQASSDNSAIQNDDDNNSISRASRKPNVTFITFTTVHDTHSQISSAPSVSASCSEITGSISPSYFTREEEMSSSQIPPWSFSHSKSNSS